MVLVRVNADRCCIFKNVNLANGPDSISVWVGVGRRNVPDDVRKVQTLLNGVSPASAGLVPRVVKVAR